MKDYKAIKRNKREKRKAKSKAFFDRLAKKKSAEALEKAKHVFDKSKWRMQEMKSQDIKDGQKPQGFNSKAWNIE